MTSHHCWVCGDRVTAADDDHGPVLCGSYECVSAYLREPTPEEVPER